jgi:hypothetical protein
MEELVVEAMLRQMSVVLGRECRRLMQPTRDAGFAEDPTMETSVLPLVVVAAKQQQAVGHMRCREQVEAT